MTHRFVPPLEMLVLNRAMAWARKSGAHAMLEDIETYLREAPAAQSVRAIDLNAVYHIESPDSATLATDLNRLAAAHDLEVRPCGPVGFVVAAATEDAAVAVDAYLESRRNVELDWMVARESEFDQSPERQRIAELEARVADLEARMERIYRERAIAASLAARMALLAGHEAGVGVDANESWDPEWRQVLYVDLPTGDGRTGQISWHLGPDNADLVEGLPVYGKAWDGTFESRDGSLVKQVAVEELSYDMDNLSVVP